jgi:hypothetical protein
VIRGLVRHRTIGYLGLKRLSSPNSLRSLRTEVLPKHFQVVQ